MRVLVIAVGIAIFLEGIVPFLSPQLFRRSVVSMLQVSDRALRVTGFAAIVVGVALVYLVRNI